MAPAEFTGQACVISGRKMRLSATGSGSIRHAIPPTQTFMLRCRLQFSAGSAIVFEWGNRGSNSARVECTFDWKEVWVVGGPNWRDRPVLPWTGTDWFTLILRTRPGVLSVAWGRNTDTPPVIIANQPVETGFDGGDFLITGYGSAVINDLQIEPITYFGQTVEVAQNLVASGAVAAGTVQASGAVSLKAGQVVDLASDQRAAGTINGDAGKIGYEAFTTDAVDFVGGGTLAQNRLVRVWDALKCPVYYIGDSTVSYVKAAGTDNIVMRGNNYLDFQIPGGTGIKLSGTNVDINGLVSITNGLTTLNIKPHYYQGHYGYTGYVTYNIGYGTHYFYDSTAAWGTKSFVIPHPLDPEDSTLVHACVEGPRADLMYSGRAVLTKGKARVAIDTDSCPDSPMLPGTFEALTVADSVRVLLTNNDSWHKVRGQVRKGGILHIEAEEPVSNVTVDWLVIAERGDDSIKKAALTDDNGKLRTHRKRAEMGGVL